MPYKQCISSACKGMVRDEKYKETLNSYFERATLAVGYSASNRIMLYVTDSKDKKITPAFIIFTISWTAVLIYLNSALLKNTGIQMSLSILISNLITTIFPAPEGQKTYFVFTSILFYLLLTSALCWIINRIVQGHASINALWSRIVPFVILFTSAIILKIVAEVQQMRLLYIVSICYIVVIQMYKVAVAPDTSKPTHSNYFTTFLDSIMCRSLVLWIQDYAKISIDNMDIAVIAFNIGIVILVYHHLTTFKRENSALPSQIEYGLGVLTFNISQQIFQMLQKKCNNKVLVSFMTVITLVACLFYTNTLYTKRMHNICVFCLGMAWSLLIEQWLSHFYSLFEYLFVYLIIFMAIQNLQETILLVYDFTEGSLMSKNLLAVMHDFESVMVIPHSASSNVGLPYIP